MADNATKTELDTAKVELDAEGKQLQLQAEKAKYLETILKAQKAASEAATPSLASYLPDVADLPKGETTLDAKAGALGAWRAHACVDGMAEKIAEVVDKKSKPPEGQNDQAHRRIVVVQDPAVLESEWVSRNVALVMRRARRRLGQLETDIAKVGEAFKKSLPRPPERCSESGSLYDKTVVDDDVRSGVREPVPATVTPEPPGMAALPSAVGVTGALGGAADLIGLLRNDFALTAGATTVAPNELTTLTIGHLAAKAGVHVEADLFGTVGDSGVLGGFADVLALRDRVAARLARLRERATPTETSLAGIVKQAEMVAKEWASAAADAEGKKTPDVLKKAYDELVAHATALEVAVGPVRSFLTSSTTVLSDVDASLAALLQPAGQGQAPLVTAARRERWLGSPKDAVTHVLYVGTDLLATDTVTRRSFVGASGVVRFIAAGSASWQLLDLRARTVQGGRVDSSSLTTLGLGTGKAAFASAGEGLQSGRFHDPRVWIEVIATVFVAALAVVLAIVGVVSIVEVIQLGLGE